MQSASSISDLLILALCGGSLVQFKGLFDQTSLPLPLALRAVRAEHGAKVLIPAEGEKRELPFYDVKVDSIDSKVQSAELMIKPWMKRALSRPNCHSLLSLNDEPVICVDCQGISHSGIQ